MAGRARARGPAGPTPVESLRHDDRRANIPTQELSSFVASEESLPLGVRYPRDPSLDPQLVWKGKDEQDSSDLVVPAVPIYIQEKIVPQVLIENLRDTAPVGEVEPELRLFDDFDGLEFEDLVDFYRHDTNWSNRMILGDSLLVMTSLAEKEGLKGKVQMIYVDPPYGIKFGSNWQVSTRKRDVKDGKAEDLTRQPEQIRAFRDTWELGIHSYLAYLRDRLVVARDLLTESGSIFVQIGDENVHLVRCLLDEVFGSENFVSQIVFTKTGAMESSTIGGLYDIMLWYSRDLRALKGRPLYTPKQLGGPGASGYTLVESEDGSSWRSMTADEIRSQAPGAPDGGRVFDGTPLSSAGAGQTTPVFHFRGGSFVPPPGSHWKTTVDGLKRLACANRIVAIGKRIEFKRYLDDFPFVPLGNVWMGLGERGFTGKKVYVVQTAAAVVERCMLMTTDPGDLVLDPTCGSGTAAYVAEQWGRRWITCDTSRVALALARTRLMAGKFPYYLLADSPEGSAREAELTGTPAAETTFANDVKRGFVYKRVPHVTLKSIAQNPDIHEGMSREEIDAAIARHADTELLVDKPYEDTRRVRVAGPFTMESLSPHRVLDEDGERPAAETETDEAGGFVHTVLTNLRKAGVQNTKRDERLSFDWLEPYAGEWLQGEGEYTDAEGATRRVAVAVGPEHGTVGPILVKEAAKEAVKGQGFDVLVVCGLAFDARVGETAREFGRLVVLPARVNADLMMGDTLKTTGAGNLFMVFGEPDVEIRRDDGKVVVEIRGVDVYDPTTGEVRSSTTDDVACWFIDTDYNGESFFVRHAYFTGADEPYDRLKRALKADIDADTWATLYSTVSRPFDPPSTGKIAVKVINHYGDEVLQVYEVRP